MFCLVTSFSCPPCRPESRCVVLATSEEQGVCQGHSRRWHFSGEVAIPTKIRRDRIMHPALSKAFPQSRLAEYLPSRANIDSLPKPRKTHIEPEKNRRAHSAHFKKKINNFKQLKRDCAVSTRAWRQQLARQQECGQKSILVQFQEVTTGSAICAQEHRTPLRRRSFLFRAGHRHHTRNMPLIGVTLGHQSGRDQRQQQRKTATQPIGTAQRPTPANLNIRTDRSTRGEHHGTAERETAERVRRAQKRRSTQGCPA